MLLWYGLLGALGVFYVAVVGVWAFAMLEGFASRRPALARRRATSSH